MSSRSGASARGLEGSVRRPPLRCESRNCRTYWARQRASTIAGISFGLLVRGIGFKTAGIRHFAEPRRASEADRTRADFEALFRQRHRRDWCSLCRSRPAIRTCPTVFAGRADLDGRFLHWRLSLSEIRSEHTDDAVRRELASAECVRQFERFSGSARPYSGIGECAPL